MRDFTHSRRCGIASIVAANVLGAGFRGTADPDGSTLRLGGAGRYLRFIAYSLAPQHPLDNGCRRGFGQGGKGPGAMETSLPVPRREVAARRPLPVIAVNPLVSLQRGARTDIFQRGFLQNCRQARPTGPAPTIATIVPSAILPLSTPHSNRSAGCCSASPELLRRHPRGRGKGWCRHAGCGHFRPASRIFYCPASSRPKRNANTCRGGNSRIDRRTRCGKRAHDRQP